MPIQKVSGHLEARNGLWCKEIWRQANAVCFDVDSTLIQEEGIDVLAEHCGVKVQVSEWTRKAMNGSVTFQEALRTRLSIVQPTLQQVTEVLEQQLNPKELLSPGVKTLIKLLQLRGTEIYLISGGFRQLIEPFADYLGIPKDHVFANRLLFNEEGDYVGFDEREPTSQSGGKPKVVSYVKQKHGVVVMIGDGATDMEASPPADTFIGFGGNQVREKVKAGAPWFVYGFQELIDELRPLENSYTHHSVKEPHKNGTRLHPSGVDDVCCVVSNGHSADLEPSGILASEKNSLC